MKEIFGDGFYDSATVLTLLEKYHKQLFWADTLERPVKGAPPPGEGRSHLPER